MKNFLLALKYLWNLCKNEQIIVLVQLHCQLWSNCTQKQGSVAQVKALESRYFLDWHGWTICLISWNVWNRASIVCKCLFPIPKSTDALRTLHPYKTTITCIIVWVINFSGFHLVLKSEQMYVSLGFLWWPFSHLWLVWFYEVILAYFREQLECLQLANLSNQQLILGYLFFTNVFFWLCFYLSLLWFLES